MEKGKNQNNLNIDNVTHVIVPKESLEVKTIKCDVCGHENPHGTEMCKNCSNYL